jgi:2-hydroxychromene-2-carboxylate isomerase
MTKSFDFLFDFGGPNGYLVHNVLPEFCARTGATASYIPVLLGGLFKATGNRAPMLRYADAPAKLAYEQLEFRRFIEANVLTRFKFNPHFPVNSLLIMRGLIAAGREGVFMPYVEAMMSAMWEEGLNLSDPEVAVAALDAAGLDGTKLIAMAGDPSVKEELFGTPMKRLHAGRLASQPSSWGMRFSLVRNGLCKLKPRWRAPRLAPLSPSVNSGAWIEFSYAAVTALTAKSPSPAQRIQRSHCCPAHF